MRVSVNFQGRVQGVGFRATAREIVLRQPAILTGWVRNEHDGSVQMELQGEQQAVEVALAELHSTMARNIHGADRTTIPDLPGETSFTIAR